MAFYKKLILPHNTKPNLEDQRLLVKCARFINDRKLNKKVAKVFTPEPKNAREIAALLAAGGLVIIPWGKEERRILCLIACYDIPGNPALMNQVKGRPLNQPVAVGCLPETTDYVADVKSSVPLKKAAMRFYNKKSEEIKEKDLLNILNECFKRSVGLIFKAKKGVPTGVTRKKDGQRTVLIAGERDYNLPHDVYNQTLLELAVRYGKVIAGTSANPSDIATYSIFDQDIAYRKFKNKVDGFVKFRKAPNRPRMKMFLSSSTIIDLTGEYPIATRWGNLHPRRFKDIFPDLVISKNISRNNNAEGTMDYLFYYLKRIVRTIIIK